MTQPSIRTADALRDAVPRPYWTDRPGAPEQAAPLSGGITCDVLVVGGGLTGLWAAIEACASNPAADVVLVEAESIAFGASGRNGGFVFGGFSLGERAILDTVGVDSGKKLYHMTLAAVDRLVHHSTIFEMNVESYRRRTAIERKQVGAGRPASYATPKNVGVPKTNDTPPAG